MFSVWLRWLPSLGRGTLAHLVLPAVTLGTYELALYLRLFNASLASEQRQDYVRSAYARGLGRVQVVVQHMLPNALLPLITVAGINLGLLLGGAVITETVFSWPGVGRLIVQSVSQRDYPVILAGVFLISVIFVAINLAVDLLYGLARSAREAGMSKRIGPSHIVAGAMLLAMLLFIAGVPFLPGYDPYNQDLAGSSAPDEQHLARRGLLSARHRHARP